MEQQEHGKKDIERFFRGSRTAFKRLPNDSSVKSDVLTRSAVFSIGAGLLDYMATRQITSLDRSGVRDEVSVLLAAAAGAFIGRLQNVHALCETERKKRTEARFNVAAAGAGGGGIGASIAAILPATAVAALGWPLIPVLAGIVLGGVGLGAGATAVYNRVSKEKFCPHCQEKGNCKQRVCRACKRLFFPEDVKLDCPNRMFLEWNTIASFLDQQGLSYLDAEELVKKHFSDWELTPDKKRVVCASFRNWVDHNKDEIADCKGRGMKEQTDKPAEEYLDSAGL